MAAIFADNFVSVPLHLNGDQHGGNSIQTFTYRPFYIGRQFCFCARHLKMLIQSSLRREKFFPALLKRLERCSFKTLRTEAFRISASAGERKY